MESCVVLLKGSFVTVNRNTQGCQTQATLHRPSFHLFLHSMHAFTIRGQINWLPTAEDTYLPGSQLCTGDPNTKTWKLFITLMLNSKRKKKRIRESWNNTSKLRLPNPPNSVRPGRSGTQWSRPLGESVFISGSNAELMELLTYSAGIRVKSEQAGRRLALAACLPW